MISTEAEPIQKESARLQYFAAFVVSFLAMGFGLQGGWSSPNIYLLVSDDTPLPSGKITMEEASWVAAICPIGALFGSTSFKFIINKFGRKKPLLFAAIPFIIYWLLIWFAQNVYYLCAARFIGGFFGAGGYVIAVLLLNEISNDNVRGALVSSVNLSETFGFLLSYIIGDFGGFYGIPQFTIALTVLFGIFLCLLPESPHFLMKTNQISEVEKSLRFYKSIRKTENDRLDFEVNRLKRSIDDISIRNETKTTFTWSAVTSGVGPKAMLIGIALVLINVFCGSFAMSNYSANIFEETGSIFSPNMSTIVIGVIQLCSSCIVVKFVDQLGRKVLFIVSCVGTALGQIVFASYMIIKSGGVDLEALNWIPLVSYSWTNFVSSLGVESLTFTILAEILPEHIREAGVSFCFTLLFFFQFVNIKFLPTFMELIGVHGSVFIFASVCLFGALFNFFVVPETRGRNHEDIMRSLQ